MQPMLINSPKTQLSGEYVAASDIYGTSGTTWYKLKICLTHLKTNNYLLLLLTNI